MDQICPRCGCRSFHYNRSRMRVECDACGHALTDPQELQLQRPFFLLRERSFLLLWQECFFFTRRESDTWLC